MSRDRVTPTSSWRCLKLGRDEQLETKNPIEEMFVHIAVPRAFLFGELLLNLVHHKVEECRSTCGGIEDEGVFVSQALGTIEARLQ